MIKLNADASINITCFIITIKCCTCGQNPSKTFALKWSNANQIVQWVDRLPKFKT